MRVSRHARHFDVSSGAWLAAVGSLVFSALDVLQMIHFKLYSICLLLHLLLVFIHFVLLKFVSLRTEDRISVAWVQTLMLFFPGVGFAVGAFIWMGLLLFRFRDDFYEEYEQYVYHTPHSLESYRINIVEESNRIPVREVLMSGDHAGKKEALFTLLEYEGHNKVELFHEALRNDDPEVVHYAATSLNYLNEQYIRSIKKWTQLLQQNDKSLEAWRELFDSYRYYLESQLLTEELAFEVRQTFKAWIARGSLQFPYEPRFTAELCYLARMEKDYMTAIRLAEQLSDVKGCQYLIYLTKAEYMYAEGKLESLCQFAQLWWNSDVEVPQEHLPAIQFWKEMKEQGVPQADHFFIRYR
ncbi:tetratricopeptide repeat protein [Paenibacillus aceris]|uniref:Tetratricopeptide (TPR) repeat protein n=1 Tax=Paenibacillus aceris TaxID=869555 RepID=A0ABS4IB56_9BACL|nr:hypothetical protein [Paenibacillus aceris]MBP1967721.1 tetratricopeptide (TPR) repeat protein [Paenibacillus aceris]NHW39104.1 hypothetical protein [Paenibacillus aceris]